MFRRLFSLLRGSFSRQVPPPGRRNEKIKYRDRTQYTEAERQLISKNMILRKTIQDQCCQLSVILPVDGSISIALRFHRKVLQNICPILLNSFRTTVSLSVLVEPDWVRFGLKFFYDYNYTPNQLKSNVNEFSRSGKDSFWFRHGLFNAGDYVPIVQNFVMKISNIDIVEDSKTIYMNTFAPREVMIQIPEFMESRLYKSLSTKQWIADHVIRFHDWRKR